MRDGMVRAWRNMDSNQSAGGFVQIWIVLQASDIPDTLGYAEGMRKPWSGATFKGSARQRPARLKASGKGRKVGAEGCACRGLSSTRGPHIRRFASRALSCTQHHCSTPRRCSILAGSYPFGCTL